MPAYQVLALLATFPIADSQLWFARRQGCMFVNVLYFFSMPVWVWMFVALERCPRQREMSLRRLRSGYYLCSASVTESEEGASIMWGSVSPGSIRDSPGDRSAFQFLMLMSESWLKTKVLWKEMMCGKMCGSKNFNPTFKLLCRCWSLSVRPNNLPVCHADFDGNYSVIMWHSNLKLCIFFPICTFDASNHVFPPCSISFVVTEFSWVRLLWHFKMQEHLRFYSTFYMR